MSTPEFDTVDRRLMLTNAYLVCRVNYWNRSLWYFVRDICGVGSITAIAICVELDWEPYFQLRKVLALKTIPKPVAA